MELTQQFKLANYLMRKEDAFDSAVAGILDRKTEDNIAGMLKKHGADKLLKHPETLVEGMCRSLGHKDTLETLCVILNMSESDTLEAIEHYARDLETLEKYKRCDNDQIKRVIRDALFQVTGEELERVKLLLSWTIVKDHGRIPFGSIERSHPCDLTHQLVNKYHVHAAYVMSLIFTQIQRKDLVEELTAAARVRCET